MEGCESDWRWPRKPGSSGSWWDWDRRCGWSTRRRLWPMRGGAQTFVTGAYHHVGSRYTQIDDHAAGFGTLDLNSFRNTVGGPLTSSTFMFDPELPAYNVFNLRFGLSRSNWEAALYVNNLTDERALLALDRERGARARVGYLVNQPRTVGLTLGFDY